MLQPKNDLVMSQFGMIYSSTDTMAIVAELWPILTNDLHELPQLQKVYRLRDVVTKLYALINEPSLRYNHALIHRCLGPEMPLLV